jgi:hypothetical protein
VAAGRGLQFYTFSGISIGIKRRLTDIAKKYAKSAIMTAKNFFLKNINMGIKNAEFYADFKFVDADLNKCP